MRRSSPDHQNQYGHKTRRIKQPYRKPFKMRNIVQVKEKPGRYTFFSKRGKKLYHGSSKNLRRRLEDEKRMRGDIRTVPGKSELIDKTEKFDVEYGDNVWDNREKEKKDKQSLPFNKK